MNVTDAIRSRRSIRSYTSEVVSQSSIDLILEAARLAPSGNNAQPWRIKVITSDEDKKLLKENNIFKQDFVYSAPVILLCCGNPAAYPVEKFEKGYDDGNALRAVRDVSIASQNMVLQATASGLGSCYIGWMDKEKVKDVFSLPKEYVIPYAITIGHPAKVPEERNKLNISDILI